MSGSARQGIATISQLRRCSRPADQCTGGGSAAAADREHESGGRIRSKSNCARSASGPQSVAAHGPMSAGRRAEGRAELSQLR